MKQNYFIVVLAHSLHGRLRRVHLPHHLVYSILALALVGAITIFGFVGSYVRMVWKVSDYNSLRAEFDQLRGRYQALQQETNQKNDQLATLQMFATEVSLSYGIKRSLDGPADISPDSDLTPSFNETLAEYNFLKSANFSVFSRKFSRLGTENNRPTLWPVNGRFTSYFGKRSDPFNGFSAFHPGVDIYAPKGTPIVSAGDGIVTRAEWRGRYGRLIVVDHGAGITTYYGHLERIEVIAGQQVRRGQLVGTAGNTGRTQGNHLHYEVRQGGSPVNPYIFLKKSARPSNHARSDFPF